MKSRNIFIQRDLYSCGACSVQSIVSFYGGYVPLNTAIEDTHTSTSGTNAYDIKNTLIKYGFNAEGIKIPFDKIDKKDLPAIAHTNNNGYNHFLVIYELRNNGVLVMDPQVGKRFIKTSEFKRIYDDILIRCRPRCKIVEYERKHKLKDLLIKELKQNKKTLLLTIIISIIILFLSLITNMYIKILETHKTPYTIILFILITFFKTLTLIKKELIDQNLSFKYTSSINKKIINYIFKLDKRYILDKREGELKTKISDSEYIFEYILKGITSIILNLILFASSLIIIFYISKRICLFMLVGVSLYTLITLLTSKKIYNLEIKYLDNYNKYNGDLEEYLNNIESIKNLNKENIFVNKLDNSYKNYKYSYLNVNKINMLVNNISNLILDIFYILIIAYAINNIDIYNVFILIAFYELCISSLTNIISLIPGFIHVKTIYNNINEFLDLKLVDYRYDTLESINDIKINSLNYSYDMKKNIISNINIDIKKGDKILLTGDSGLGKSTLAKCISGHIKDYIGSIMINDKEIKDISNESLSNILYVGQNESLITDTLENNITFDNFDEDLFNKVISISKVDEIINKKGNNTFILENGINYSGGERARIILARSLYHKPDVLILDETLSSISNDLEDEIIDNLLQMEDLTLIYITHRNKKEKFNRVVELRKDGLYDIK